MKLYTEIEEYSGPFPDAKLIMQLGGVGGTWFAIPTLKAESDVGVWDIAPRFDPFEQLFS